VLHPVHMSGAADYNLPFAFANRVVSRTMNREGLVELRCNAGHVWMSAEIFVVPHSYYTVTDSEGNFELSDMPPGDYEVVAWHEGWKVVGQAPLYDVMTQAQVRRPTFSQPLTWSKSVSVTTHGTTEVKFSISDKGTDLASSR
jgi:polysaccharide lyase family 4-like protein